MSTTPQTITARYMTRFQCTGSACEDNCCQGGWQIQIDRRHHLLLKEAMSASAAERDEFRAAVEPSHPQTEDDYARLKLNPRKEGASCHFLDAQKLCSVQGRYGEHVLSQACAIYPRTITRQDERLEVWGMLSCPEVARLCLLHDDAMEIVDAPPGISPRLEASTGYVGERAPYQRYVDDVRATAFRLLSMREYPIATRLFMLAYLGKQTAPFFHEGVATVDEARLSAAIDQACDPGTVALWNRELATMPGSEAVAANLVGELLSERLRQSTLPRFRDLVVRTMASYGQVGEGSLPQLWQAYTARRQQWMALEAARIDLYFENYAKNYWMREWHVLSNDLLAHTLRLLVRVTVLRFLLFSHPSLLEAVALAPEGRGEALDRAAVEVFYKFTRAIEHDAEFLGHMTRWMMKEGTGGFTHAALLASH